MKYPDVIDGAIAASAPIWQLADTVRRETLDMQAVAITRGVSKAGGATDQCRDNLRAAWPLLQEVGRTPRGLFMLSESARSCSALQSPEDLGDWAQGVFFFMAEGNYPFPSTYITYSLLPGHATPLPAWPMRVACEGLNKDFGIKLSGSITDVNFSLALGDINVTVDWANTTGNGDTLTADQIRKSGVLDLASAVADAAGVWHNLTMDKDCFAISSFSEEEAADAGAAVRGSDGVSTHRAHVLADARVAVAEERASEAEARAASAEARLAAMVLEQAHHPTATATATVAPTAAATAAPTVDSSRRKLTSTSSTKPVPTCPTCPPCDDCPPCPVSYCDWEDQKECSYPGELSKTFSWEGIGCNEALSQIDIKGVGRDIFWPPEVADRDYTVESIVGPRQLSSFGCAGEYEAEGLRGAPMVGDAWSGWMSAYYGGRNVSHHRNIVWSNGALDPWSGQGVYPPGGGTLSMGPGAVNAPAIPPTRVPGMALTDRLCFSDGAKHLQGRLADRADSGYASTPPPPHRNMISRVALTNLVVVRSRRAPSGPNVQPPEQPAMLPRSAED